MKRKLQLKKGTCVIVLATVTGDSKPDGYFVKVNEDDPEIWVDYRNVLTLKQAAAIRKEAPCNTEE